MDKLESNFETRCSLVDDILESKADSATIASLKAQIEALDHFKKNYEKKLVMQESYDKRQNILIHRVTEDSDCAWEKKEKLLKNFKIF